MGLLARNMSRAHPFRGTLRRPTTAATTLYRQAIQHRKKGKSFLEDRRKQREEKEPIIIDNITMEAIETEVLSLMYAGDSSRSCKVTEIAMALRTSVDVVDLYASADDETKTDVNGISVAISNLLRSPKRLFRAKRKDNDVVNRKYKFIQAMEELEKRPESIAKKVSTWEDARMALSAVLVFRDDSAKTAVATKQAQEEAATADADKYTARVSQSPNFHRLLASERSWRQIELQPLPSKIAKDESKQSHDSAIEQVDAKRDETLEAKYKEVKERLIPPAVQEVEQRLKEKEAEDLASSLMRKLTREEKAIVEEAIRGRGDPGKILAQIGSDSVQRRSMQLLQPGQWLNDEVIHYFLIVLAKRDEELCRQDSSRKPTHFFKSFFFTKLLNEGDANPAKDGKYEYKNVKRWSKHVKGKDIFKLSKIVFPINQSQMHWVCAVAFMEEKRIQFYDSMGSGGQFYLDTIFRYIKDEHMDKKGSPLPDLDKWKLVKCTRDTPRQQNGFDCGVFTCMFADFLSKDCPLLFNQQHITQCRERIALSIMNGTAIM